MPFCANIDGPRNCHIKWNKSEKDKSDDTAYMCNLKKNGKINSSTKQKQFVVGNKPIHIQYSASQIEKGKYIILFISGI